MHALKQRMNSKYYSSTYSILMSSNTATCTVYNNIAIAWRIVFRGDSGYNVFSVTPAKCKRRLNRAVLRMRPCLCRYGTIKIPPCPKIIGARHRLYFVALHHDGDVPSVYMSGIFSYWTKNNMQLFSYMNTRSNFLIIP